MSTTVERLRELHAKATPAPWRASLEFRDHHSRQVQASDGSKWGELATLGCGPYEGHGSDNAALVAESRNALPALLDCAEALRAIARVHDKGCDDCEHDDKGCEDFADCKVLADARAALAALEAKQ